MEISGLLVVNCDMIHRRLLGDRIVWILNAGMHILLKGGAMLSRQNSFYDNGDLANMLQQCYRGLFISIMFSAGTAIAADTTLFEQDFESGYVSDDVASPKWSLKAPSLGPNVGPGRMFEVVSGVSHSGVSSLRFNYDGMNGICNTCGTKGLTHRTGADGVPYFLDSNGSDLTIDPIFADDGRFVFNTSNGHSKWSIVSVNSQNGINDKLTLSLAASNVEGGQSEFNSGDNVIVARVCGIDGFVGKNINRRSDCNRAIAYFNNVSQKYGQSIFRRVYFMIDRDAILPEIQKLRYWSLKEGTHYLTLSSGNRNVYSQLQIGGVVTGMPRIFKPEGADVIPGKWYYLEEEFKPESSDGANDGEYRLWFAESGKETITPLVAWSGLGLKPTDGGSLWGNHQHMADSHGYWYIDDFKISLVRNGPEKGVAPPKPPAVFNR